MRNLPTLAKVWFAICIAAIPVAIAIQVSVWNECRANGNSFFYCMSLISHR